MEEITIDKLHKQKLEAQKKVGEILSDLTNKADAKEVKVSTKIEYEVDKDDQMIADVKVDIGLKI